MRTLVSICRTKTARAMAMAALALTAGFGLATAQTTTGNAEVDPSLANSNMIVINPLKFFWMYNASYYHRLSSSMVIGGGLQVPSVSGISGFGANAEIRFHLSNKAMRGFYIAPNVSFTSLSTTVEATQFTDEYTAKANAFSIGALLGWQWFPGDDFAMGLGIGADYYILSTSDSENEDNTVEEFGSFKGTLPALRFDIGYAF